MLQLAVILFNMRLSGNYLERLFVNVIPWTLFASLVILMVRERIEKTVVTFLISTCAFWLLDTLVIFFKFKNPRSLKSSNTLTWGGELISPHDIIEITPILDKRFKWSFRMVQFLLKDGRQFMVIDKPQTVIEDFMNKPSKTKKRLIEQHPELMSKVGTLKAI
jgi:hypothetical protein